MIFVTVGTHEQPFDRLIKYMDMLCAKGIVKEEVVIQTGYSTFVPAHCTHQQFFAYADMLKEFERARIIITHGGPASFLQPIRMGKVPIVVPRRKCYHEHVNDHQLEFCRAVDEKYGNIILVEDVEELGTVLENYDELASKRKNNMTSNNHKFIKRFEEIVDELMEEK